MSNRYKGGVISATPPTTTGGNDGVASGAWTLEQQMQAQAAGLWPNQPVFYIEDVFSTYLYTGTGAAQTITNGINLSGKGGLVWLKDRTTAYDNGLFDTARGAGYRLISNTTDAQNFSLNYVSSFNATGFSLGAPSVSTNASGDNYVSWTFRKQPKFFDVVTWTGDGTANRAIPHNLGSQPGFITCKKTSGADAWQTAHRGNGTTGIYGFVLNDSAQGYSWSDYNTYITSTVFYPDQLAGFMNTNGQTYVAYLFAHNAGGFGLTGADNVISCGSYTGNGAAGGQLINLGYEAQWVMIKQTNASGGWWMMDVMRGYTVNGDYGGDASLYANTSQAEQNNVLGEPASQGFRPIQDNVNQSGQSYIYIAIRRGPMKVPTSGTSVFSPNTATGNGTSNTLTTNFPVDLSVDQPRAGTGPAYWIDRLRGGARYIDSANTTAETTHGSALIGFQSNTTLIDANYGSTTDSYVNWAFRRAPSFFDEVCYTGTEVSGQTFNHNLGAVPEMMIVKARSGATDWTVYHSALGASARIYLNATNAANTGTAAPWNSTAPTSTVFSLGNAGATNLSGTTFVNYLFSTCAGVSKVGSYTGTATTKQIDCGFTGGARFVLIKRTDSTGAWYVWDSARGIVSGNDPYLLLNSTAAEVTGTDYVDTYSAGFEISSTAPAAINANGGTFIFLAIA